MRAAPAGSPVWGHQLLRPMRIAPFAIERWFGKYEFNCKYNVAESGVHPLTLGELLRYAGHSAETLMDISLGYVDSLGTYPVREAISTLYPNTSPDNVLVTTGAIEANFLVFTTIVRQGDTVIAEYPAYQQLYEVARAVGANVKLWELREEEDYHPNLERLRGLVDRKTRLIVMNHPHNPTGSVLSRDELAEIIRFAAERGIRVHSDEVFRGLEVDGPVSPSAREFSDDAIVVGSLSKAFGLPGVRIGWVVGPRDVIEAAWVQRDYTSICPSAVGEHLAIMAVEAWPEIRRRNQALIRRNLELLNGWVSHHSDVVSMVPPRGGVLAFPRIKLGVSSEEFCTRLVEDYGVLLVPGECFSMPGHFRIGFGGDTQVLKTGLDLMSRHISSLSL